MLKKRSKIRTEARSKEYQAAVSELSLKVMCTKGITSEDVEFKIDAALAESKHSSEMDEALLILLLQIRSLLALRK